ncbi:alpha mannosidase-like protein [Apophysomyces sp. BC1034]|nr:alpha mannosidase-like protein [Apophysomyces sp. BC1034]
MGEEVTRKTVDTLDTLAIVGSQSQFEDAVDRVLKQVSFDQDNKVQVFELNIRALGGLLSAHSLASDPSFGHAIKGYNGGLLRLAEDLAQRLLPAFSLSKTGIPYPRVNLRYGVPRTETVETCTAGAGSLVLEFGVLSRLTGNPHYEMVAKRALKAIWDRRSDIGLFGNVINIQTGQWVHTASSTGAGVDSFFEYLLKAYVLFGEDEYLEMFEEAYTSLMRHVRDSSGYMYRNVHMSSGNLMATWIDSLSSFLPGLQVLHGDIDAAIKGHLVFYNIWRRYHALPERFDFYQKTVDIGFYPLRPEFAESTYHLYQATKDPFYLHVGEMIIEDLNNRTRVSCGFATVGDVRSGRLEDRMESFMLSETLKYLYLLFDTDHYINHLDSNFVFTTEGHILPLSKQYLDKGARVSTTIADRVCEPHTLYNIFSRGNRSSYITNPRRYITHPQKLDMSSIPYRHDADFAATLVGLTENISPDIYQNGYCTSPESGSLSFELTFGHSGRTGERNKSPRLIELIGGFLIKSLSGVKLELNKRPRSQGGGYYAVGENDVLMVTMDAIKPYLRDNVLQLETIDASGHHSAYSADSKDIEIRLHTMHQSWVYIGTESQFGVPVLSLTGQSPVIFLRDDRLFGCQPYEPEDRQLIQDKVLILSRGECSFYRKAMWAQEGGARAVIFVNNEDNMNSFRALPSTESDMPTAEVTIPTLTITKEAGIDLLNHLDSDDTVAMEKGKKKYCFIPQMKPSTSTQKPRITSDDCNQLNPLYTIKISEENTPDTPADLIEGYERNKDNQASNASLRKRPAAFNFFKNAIDQPIDNLRQYLWTHGYENDIPEDDKQFIDLIRLVLTDFWAIAVKPEYPSTTNERAPFVESIIPLFKYLSAIMRSVAFVWCEKGLSICMPQYGKLMDGIGTTLFDNIDRVLIESSGQVGDLHTEEDTLKLLEYTSVFLQEEKGRYQQASHTMIAKRRLFGIQVVGHKVTLLSSFVIRQSWQSLGLPVGALGSNPQSLESAQVLNMLQEQDLVTQQLINEHNDCVRVPKEDTLRSHHRKSMSESKPEKIH